VLLGTYEESCGFERAIDAVPYWKDGRMGWDAPPDGFDDARIPDTPLTIVERVTVQEVVVENKSLLVSALASIVVPTVLGVLMVVCSVWYGYRHCTGTKRDDEIESFVRNLNELRDKLQVCRSHVLIMKKRLLSTHAHLQKTLDLTISPLPFPLCPSAPPICTFRSPDNKVTS